MRTDSPWVTIDRLGFSLGITDFFHAIVFLKVIINICRDFISQIAFT